MKCLFIGGPAAGRVMDVDIRQTYIRVPVITQTPATLYSEAGTEPVNSKIKETIYKFDCATGKDGKRRVLYVAEGSGDPLDTLLNFYATADHSARSDT